MSKIFGKNTKIITNTRGTDNYEKLFSNTNIMQATKNLMFLLAILQDCKNHENQGITSKHD